MSATDEIDEMIRLRESAERPQRNRGHRAGRYSAGNSGCSSAVADGRGFETHDDQSEEAMIVTGSKFVGAFPYWWYFHTSDGIVWCVWNGQRVVTRFIPLLINPLALRD